MKVQGMALPLGVEGAAPSALLIFPVGEPPPNDGRKWRFTPADLETVAAEFAKRSDPMPILYDHGVDPAKGGRAAGWVDSVEVRPDGLYANVRWTDEARTEIRSGAWAFRSPGFEGDPDADGFIRPRALTETSLVNLPAIGGMSPVTAGKMADPPKAGEGENMGNDVTVTAGKKAAATSFDKAGILAALRETFAIPDAVTDSMFAGLIASALEGGKGEGDEPAMPPMPGASATPSAPAPGLAALSAKVDAQAADLEAMKVTRETEAIIEKGRTDLVLTPALEDVARTIAKHAGLEAIRTYVASLKPTAPAPGAVVPAGAGPAPSDAPSPRDHVGRYAAAFDPQRFATHKAAVAYMDKAIAAGRKVSYRDAVIATTRKIA